MGVWDRTRRNILSVRLRIWSALASSRLTVVGSVLLRRWPILVEMEVNKDHGFCHLISAGPVLLMWMLDAPTTTTYLLTITVSGCGG